MTLPNASAPSAPGRAPGAREQGRDHLERRVLGRRPDEVMVPASTCGRKASCCALLKRWISVDEEDRRSPAPLQLGFRLLHHVGAAPSPPGGRPRTTPPRPRSRWRGDARASSCPLRRPPEDERLGLPALEHLAQHPARTEEMLLSDELVDAARPHRSASGARADAAAARGGRAKSSGWRAIVLRLAQRPLPSTGVAAW